MNVQARKSRDAERTAADILRAAQQIFSTRSYTEAGVREITAKAHVTPALVNRYFGGKEKLFEAALRDALDVRNLTEGARENFGARDVALRVLNEEIVAPLVAWLGDRDAEDRAAQILVVATGFFTYRGLLPLAPLAGRVSPGMRQWLADTLQAIVD